MYKVVYAVKAIADLDSLDVLVSQRIVKKLEFFAAQAKPLIFARTLTASTLGTYRFRIGDYRVIFDLDHSGNVHILKVLRIKHRKDIYNL